MQQKNGIRLHMNAVEPDRFRFRAWDKYYKMMWNNVIVDSGDIDEDGTVYAGCISLRGCPPHGVHIGGHYIRPLEDVKLMQSCGCADNNGNEMFEGDIVKRIDGKKICNGKHGFIVWALGSWMIEDNEGALHMPLFENHSILQVVGNNYENRALLDE